MAFSFLQLWKSFRPFPAAFGLDISDRSLKFAHLERREEGYRVHTFGERIFDKGIVERGKILLPDKLGEELRAIIKEHSPGASLPPYAVVALPEEEVFLRVIQVPVMSAQELREAVRWETEANIPLSIDDVYYDYQILGQGDLAQKMNHLDILVAAVSKEIVDGYLKALEEGGVTPLVIEPESASIVRSLVPQKNWVDPVLLVDIGVVRTRFVVHAAGAVRFTSFLTISVDTFLHALIKSLGVDDQEAQRILFSIGINRAARNGEIFEALVPLITDLKEQMEKYMDFYLTHEHHEHRERHGFSQVLLAGGGALIPGLADYLVGDLKVPVSVGNPWTNILSQPLQEIPEIPYREAVRYAAVLGLALRGAQPVKNLEENTFYSV